MGNDLWIRGGTIVEPDPSLVRKADILVRDGRIDHVGNASNARSAVEVDATDCVVIAGLFDAHTHSNQVLTPRLDDQLWFDEWMLLNVYLSPFPTTAGEAYLAAAVTAEQLLASGAVGVLDHAPVLGADNALELVDATIQAYIDVGIRARVAPLFADGHLWHRLGDEIRPDDVLLRSLPPAYSAEQVLDQARAYLRRWTGRHERISCALGPTGAERCSDVLLNGVAELKLETGAALHMHAPDSPVQRFAFPQSPIRRLLDGGLLGPDTSLAHAVWVDASEIDLLAETRTTVVHCPVSNQRVGDGIAALPRFLAAGVPVALGGDGGLVDESFDVFGVMQSACLSQRAIRPPSEWLTAGRALELCQAGGARALGLAPGGFQRGQRADLVVLDGAEMTLSDGMQLTREVVFGRSREAVRHVTVGGRLVFDAGEPVMKGWRERRRLAADVRAGRTALSARKTGVEDALVDAVRRCRDKAVVRLGTDWKNR